jgi:hypothetical protein
MAQVKPAPSKAQKSPSKDAAYFLFSNCAPGTSTQKTKSGKCAKSATAAAVGNPITVDVTVDEVDIVDVVGVVEVVETVRPVTSYT